MYYILYFHVNMIDMMLGDGGRNHSFDAKLTFYARLFKDSSVFGVDLRTGECCGGVGFILLLIYYTPYLHGFVVLTGCLPWVPGFVLFP
jgi:hypothetical protein